MTYHRPVLLENSVDGLITDPSGVYVDCTFGGGGHSREILERLSSEGKLYAFDQDADAVANNLQDSRFQLIQQNFRYLKNYLRFYGVSQVDGVLADLGVSSHQFDTAERGFSTRFEGDLDMRMNQNQKRTAATLLNELSEHDLAVIFRNYGELTAAKKWVRMVVEQRAKKPFDTISSLKSLIEPHISPNKRNKFFAQLFQALRIEVNEEMHALEELLLQTKDIIKPGGRLVVISYHSLEDRMVKRYMKTGLFAGEPERDLYGNYYTPFEVLQNKVIIPEDEEIESNPRARSAKMRIATRKNDTNNI
ncbi:MAG: 16S rRNA (cytosine(1402)-N(4))-methyltransferase RsmH [Weeksellaceae bacterium]|nr:16S rRNA (cytosine(1402)-N(4))-methyltransferase RsmH [Weeksellaceae bacterium]